MIGRFVRLSFDREPVAAISCVIGAVALALPLVVVPIRRNLGYPTEQFDGPKFNNPTRSGT